MILGAGTGVAIGAATGSQVKGDRGENAIAGAVIGGVVGGLASYLIHESLQSRDERVRHDMLFNMEKYDVLGRESVTPKPSLKGDKCNATREVDGRLVTIPCRYLGDYPESEDGKQ